MTHVSLYQIHSMPTAIMASKSSDYKLETAPFDPRFPNTNQTKYCYQSFLDFHRCTKYCYQSFLDFHRCTKIKGESYEPCHYFKRVFSSMCPNSWVEKWNDQLEDGTFAGNI
ncbi:hypothetical protein WDU94_006515 [Cyamophila willieti]